MPARAHLIVTGRVQGVCFRFETQREALRIGVVGWVRNRADGSVEAEIEGCTADVNALIDWCRTGPPVARVDDVQVSWKEPGGTTDDFEIRY